ncbi:hypothetical protein ACSMXN_09405 [Jatrophihabitans sp. DSM 45814]
MPAETEPHPHATGGIIEPGWHVERLEPGERYIRLANALSYLGTHRFEPNRLPTASADWDAFKSARYQLVRAVEQQRRRLAVVE